MLKYGQDIKSNIIVHNIVLSQGAIVTGTSSFLDLRFSFAAVCCSCHALMNLTGGWRKAKSQNA